MKVSRAFIFLCLLYGVQARCRMRGQCSDDMGVIKNCVFDEEAPPLIEGLSTEEEEELFEIFEQRCPNFFYDEDGNRIPNDQIFTCCDADQIRAMSESLSLADGLLGRCPTCFHNFAQQICQMNCAPDQDRFVDVYVETALDGTDYVEEIDYRLHGDFMDGAHASCIGVSEPQTGMPAIFLMCGSAPVCDADSWFTATGDAENPFITVQVNFLRTADPETSMSVRAIPCNETVGDNLPCSCMDCLANCPSGGEPFVPEICTVFSLSCIGFSVGIVVFVIFVAIFIFLTVREYRKSRKNTVDDKSVQSDGFNAKFIIYFESLFSKLGAFVSSNSVLFIMVTTWIVFAMIYGFVNLNLTTNPIELWSAPESRSRMELEYFNSRFGPFYRASQVFLQIRGLDSFEANNVTYGPAFRFEAVQELLRLEDAILNIGRDDGGVTLEQVCYAPLRGRGGEELLDHCVIMSVSVYFGADRNNINNETYLNRIQGCINNYFGMECLASWGGGSDPEITFGGYLGSDVIAADTLLINFPIANSLTEEGLMPILEWEQKFLDLLHDYEANWKADFVDVSFGTERSIEDEIRRVSQAEAIPIAVSYLLIFIYVTISLGNVRYCNTWFIDSKILVAVGSIIVVLAAIFCAMGLMGYVNITTTLLAINVIPFFVLSVGIDNVFLMVNALHDIQSNLKEYEDYSESLSFEKKRRFVFSKMLAKTGPSMFVSSVTQITCFAIGTLANFPAVSTFAVFACFSLAFLFVFQVTTVVAILALDYKRVYQNRYDVLCCIKKSDKSNPNNENAPYVSLTKRLMKPYSKFLLRRPVKIIVVVAFMALLGLSIMWIPQIEVGLDQQLALPVDSYVYKYLESVNNIMVIGPPVYFVLKAGLNFTDPAHQNTICGSQLCNDDSLTTQIFLASQHSNVTYISRPSNAWIDDFFEWTNLYGTCCRYNTTDNSFCQSSDNSPECSFCSIDRNTEWNNGLRPSLEAFETYIPFFLRDAPSEVCSRAGLASYSGSVNYVLDAEGRATVHDTNFMAYHSTLSTSKDYITAVQYGYEISANISRSIREHTGLDIEVFPYSVFYVFYEQYLTMWTDTFASLGYCLIGALIFNLLASGFNFLTTFSVIITSIMVVIDMMGVMYIWNIPLNAVSCVNLIVSIGIAVEYCSHIAYAFTTSKATSGLQVHDALETVGATVITGITFTNIPIIVLAFSYTEIIEVFFFRMFFSIVILSLLHGMIFFPVLLSYLSNLTSK